MTVDVKRRTRDCAAFWAECIFVPADDVLHAVAEISQGYLQVVLRLVATAKQERARMHCSC